MDDGGIIFGCLVGGLLAIVIGFLGYIACKKTTEAT
jgi:hypothetical protein